MQIGNAGFILNHSKTLVYIEKKKINKTIVEIYLYNYKDGMKCTLKYLHFHKLVQYSCDYNKLQRIEISITPMAQRFDV